MRLVNQMHRNAFFARLNVQDLISLRNICAASLMTSIDRTFEQYHLLIDRLIKTSKILFSVLMDKT